MSEQTALFTTESSTNGGVPLSAEFWQGQSDRISHPDVEFRTSKFIRKYSTSWHMPDSGLMPHTSPEKDSQVADNIFGEAVMFILLLLVDGVNQRQWESFAEYLSRDVTGFRVQLAQALEELDQVVDEAQLEGFEIPSSTAIDNADHIIKRIYDHSPHSIQVYPMPDGEVAIDVTNDGSSVLILCCSDGGALCFVNINGNQRRARYSNSDALPDGFMREALEELQQTQSS